ncbi:MAG: hypothetical protein ACTSVD_09840 [Candidatus Thorarchaeota archaeon]|nr:MAG: hypothetical protein DRO73_01355 [Candidatus Thorarchaeota archaeon]
MSVGIAREIMDVLESVSRPLRDNGSFLLTDERGLIIAERLVADVPTNAFAAMASLMAHTAKRVLSSLGGSGNTTVTVVSDDFEIHSRGFLVRNKMFQLSVVVHRPRGRFAYLRHRSLRRGNVERLLGKAADEIQWKLQAHIGEDSALENIAHTQH